MHRSKKNIILVFLFLFTMVFNADLMAENNQLVVKHVLKNGLTVLVKPNHLIPEVAIRLFYHVGSKDEESGELGIAHLIEHMIFKGTQCLSETDISSITSKLSGYCNAHTSHDYTCYEFNFPTQHWSEALSILADCMCNCTFKQEMLNSELKAVIQELKMRRDNYPLVLYENMICTIFNGHPYAHPIIGYKHDLWGLSNQTLINFYKKHYVPNNAILVIVGDVDPETVFGLAKKYFGQIPASSNYQKKNFYVPQDLMRKSIEIYRDTKHPYIALAYKLPGCAQRSKYLAELMGDVLSASILSRKLKDELQLVTSISAGVMDQFDGSLFMISYVPKDFNHPDVINKINRLVQVEIDHIVEHGLPEKELCKAIKSLCLTQCYYLADNYKQALEIGLNYLLFGDENYLYTYLDQIDQVTVAQLQKFSGEYLVNSRQYQGKILPLDQADRKQWLKLQELSDCEDQRILEGKIRESAVEPGAAVHQVQIQMHPGFNFPISQKIVLANGLEVLYYHNPSSSKKTAKIDMILNLKADHYHDPINQQGLCNFVMDMLPEGTEHYTKHELNDLLGMHGMSLSCETGQISMSLLSDNLKLAANILCDLLSNSSFETETIEAVRARILTDIKQFWDSPKSIANYLANQAIYPAGHPYRYLKLGTEDSVSSITRTDLINFYHRLISPSGARLAIVGDLNYTELIEVCDQILAKWSGNLVVDIQYSALEKFTPTEVNYPINRDQVTLVFAGPSISRLDQDWLSMQLFNEILSNGLDSKLFKLRDASGLFYTINGNLTVGADQQPGTCRIATLVSCGRLAEAELKIKQAIDSAALDITDDELSRAKQMLLNNCCQYFKTNQSIAKTFLFLRKFDLPDNYFELRSQAVVKLTKQDLQQAANRVLNSNKMTTIRVGRV